MREKSGRGGWLQGVMCLVLLALVMTVSSAQAQQGGKDPVEAAINRAMAFGESGNYDKAVKQMQHAISLVKGGGVGEWEFRRSLKELLGLYNVSWARALNTQAIKFYNQGQYAKAEPLYRRALAIWEKALGPDHPDVATSINNLGLLYNKQGQYARAEPLYRRALAIREKALGPDHPDVATSLDSLAALYDTQGQYARAEPLYRRALAIREELGPDHPDVATSLNNLAALYDTQGQYARAEPFYRRALAIWEKALGPDHPRTALGLNNLAVLYDTQGQYARAEPLYRRALAIREKALGPDHPDVATSLNNLAALYDSQGQYARMEPLLRRALAIREKAQGSDHPDVAVSLNNLAELYRTQGQYARAEPLYRRALAIWEKALGPDHPRTALALSNLAGLYLGQHDWRQAAGYWRRATSVFTRRALRRAGEKRGASASKVKSEIGQNTGVFNGLVKAIYRHQGQNRAAAGETFLAVQWAASSSAGSALAQMAVRAAAKSPEVAKLVRTRQDLGKKWQVLDEKLIKSHSLTKGKGDKKRLARLAARLKDIDRRIAAIDRQLARDFPDYAALTSPRPLEASAVQKLLRDGEALVVMQETQKIKNIPAETFLWVVSREGIEWRRATISAGEISAMVKKLRASLDLDAVKNGKAGLFDVALAHQLYKRLFGPVDALIADKKHLMFVPSGAMTSLPAHLLVTQPPAPLAPGQAYDYAAAKWLLKRQAVTVLPSVNALRALRILAKKSHASKPLIGYGNPIFGSQQVGGAFRGADPKSARPRAFKSYFLDGLANIEALAQSLRQLPETADELRNIARAVGASAKDIHLGADASETRVKHDRLRDYRIVYFATHALVAGEAKDFGALAEPALALSLPFRPGSDDDGLLSASEITTLDLDADWVVLSACNTAAGDKPGAEALSGLARAFYYAGARALLVSHWPVQSAVATRITSQLFRSMAKDPGLGRSQALRRTMLNLMNDTSNPSNAYPAIWAPFVVVGEGGQQGQGNAKRPISALHLSALPKPVRRSYEKQYGVQIAARRSQEGALSFYQKIKASYPEIFAPYQPVIRQANLGKRGVYYRLSVEPFLGKKQASDFCRLLKAKKIGCLAKLLQPAG